MDGRLLSETFVELADTMVAGFDVIEFMHVLTDRSVDLLGASAAGLLLADPRGELRVVAASSEQVRLLELFQIQHDQGPCLDCFRRGEPVSATDLTAAAGRWPKGKLAERAGIDMDQAFEILRSYARARNRRLSELAMAFVTGSEDLPALSAGQSPLPGPGQPPRPPR